MLFKKILPNYATYKFKVLDVLNTLYPNAEWLSDDTAFTKMDVVYTLMYLRFSNRHIAFNDETSFINELTLRLANHLPELYSQQLVFFRNKLNDFADMINRGTANIIDTLTSNERQILQDISNSQVPTNLIIEDINKLPVNDKSVTNSTDIDSGSHNTKSVFVNGIDDIKKLLNSDFNLRSDDFLKKFNGLFINVVIADYDDSGNLFNVLWGDIGGDIANQTDLSDILNVIDTNINHISADVDTKADKSVVDDLIITVGLKADKSYVDDTFVKKSGGESWVTLEYLQANYYDKFYIDLEFQNISFNKLDVSQYDTDKESLRQYLTRFSDDYNGFKDGVNTSITELNNDIDDINDVLPNKASIDYVNTQASSTLIQSKAYTDSQIPPVVNITNNEIYAGFNWNDKRVYVRTWINIGSGGVRVSLPEIDKVINYCAYSQVNSAGNVYCNDRANSRSGLECGVIYYGPGTPNQGWNLYNDTPYNNNWITVWYTKKGE